MRRVVITGLGAVTPLGLDAASTWDSAVNGRSGIDFIQAFDPSGFRVRIAAEVKGFEPEGLAPPKELRRMERYTQIALAAATEATQESGVLDEYARERVGVVFGSAIGGLIGIAEQHQILLERGADRVSPYFL